MQRIRAFPRRNRSSDPQAGNDVHGVLPRRRLLQDHHQLAHHSRGGKQAAAVSRAVCLTPDGRVRKSGTLCRVKPAAMPSCGWHRQLLSRHGIKHALRSAHVYKEIKICVKDEWEHRLKLGPP